MTICHIIHALLHRNILTTEAKQTARYVMHKPSYMYPKVCCHLVGETERVT